MSLMRRKLLSFSRILVICLTIFGIGAELAGAFSLPEDVPVNQKDGMDMQFLEKTRQLEMYLEQKKYVEARLLLLQLQHLFPQLTFAERTSVEGIHAISETFIHLKHLLSAVQLNPNEIRHVARQFSLAVDALVFSDDTEQSRWKKQLKTLMDRVDSVRQDGTSPTKTTVEQLLMSYKELRPALLVRTPTAVVGQLDAIHRQVKQLKLERNPSDQEWSTLLGQLSDLYRQIFYGKDRPTFAEALSTPLSRLMIGLAAFLILSLTYTAWCYRVFQSSKGA